MSGLYSLKMEQSESCIRQPKVTPDWEEALHLYEKMVACNSEALRVRATIKLARLSKHAPDNVLEHTIPILVELLGSSHSSNSNMSIQEAAAYCLTCMARIGDGRLAIIISESSAISFLLNLLPNSNGNFRRVLIKFLWSLLTFGNHNRVFVARNGGLEITINMLSSSADGSRRYLLEILSALALLREVRRVIIGLGGLRFLVEATMSGSMISRERACQAIGLLAVTRQARHMLVELGVIPVLVELFRVGDSSTKLVAGNALGVVSAHIGYIRPVGQAGAIPLYAELLRGPDPIGKEIAEDVFCILALVDMNVVAIVDHLVRILREDNDEAKAAAADVLWDLSGYKHSVSIIRNSGAIPVLVDLLGSGSAEVREKVSGAIAQLSYNEVHQIALADVGAIPILIDMLHEESEELRDNAAEALVKFSEDPLHRDRMSEAFDVPAFQNMQSRLVQINTSDEHMARSMRRMSIQQLTWDPDLA
ncbi:hypothetical protein L1049_000826 [Liquidambar formosana]|uniref:Uncharacterized protein n=1 Tax=Liquidambar formosana TaxID=63359 RepID=A0AAP0N9G6_LIQFO